MLPKQRLGSYYLKKISAMCLMDFVKKREPLNYADGCLVPSLQNGHTFKACRVETKLGHLLDARQERKEIRTAEMTPLGAL